jgi:sulfur carrier protein
MKLTVNGRPHDHSGDGTLDALLKEIGANPLRVGILLNGEVVRNDARGAVRLCEGDIAEVITFVGGG